jgi:serine/threonine protein kinase
MCGVMFLSCVALNIVRIRTDFKLIDFDAAVDMHVAAGALGGSGGCYVGLKHSSGYVPPEMVRLATLSVDDQSRVEWAVVRGFHFEDDKIVPDRHLHPLGEEGVEASVQESLDDVLLKAHKSFDIWSLGVVLYHLCTNETLFHCDGQDNIDQDSLRTLYHWKPEAKAKKLSKVHNALARNLISKLLNKLPEMRPDIPQILAHPFLSGKPYTRLAGEPPSYDVFISYRVAADSHHAEVLYTHLTRDKGLKVFWDKKCLPSGVSWIEGRNR